MTNIAVKIVLWVWVVQVLVTPTRNRYGPIPFLEELHIYCCYGDLRPAIRLGFEDMKLANRLLVGYFIWVG